MPVRVSNTKRRRRRRRKEGREGGGWRERAKERRGEEKDKLNYTTFCFSPTEQGTH